MNSRLEGLSGLQVIQDLRDCQDFKGLLNCTILLSAWWPLKGPADFFTKNPKNPKMPKWCFSQIQGLEPSGVLPLPSPRRVSMTQASISL